MKKIFTRNLFVYMLIALLVTICAIFTLQTFVSNQDNTNNSLDKLATVKEKLMANDQQIAQLTETLGQNNLAKTRAFAEIIAADKSIINSKSKMAKIMERLIVNELHVIDAKGIITHSTVDAYLGFDMNSGEQSRAFMTLVDDPSQEIVQEPQPNAAEGTLMQYIGVARKDAEGLVQVGIRPEMLEQMLASTQIDIVLNDIEFGNSGYVYAVDANTGLVLSFPDTSFINTNAEEIGLPSISNAKGSAKVNGVSGYYVTDKYQDIVIGTFLPSHEYYQNRFSQTLVVSLSVFIIFTVLLIMINRMLENTIVSGIHRIANGLKEIADGNFSLTISENGNPEFTMLSASVNKMVTSMCLNMEENQNLLAKQKEDMQQNILLINSVKNACANLEEASQNTFSNAQAIHQGTEDQENAVRSLKSIMNELMKELSSSADASSEVANSTQIASQKVLSTKEQMENLKISIQKISDMSTEIEKIIGEINAIAQQTNMLSLNASIEAARVGEMGKGFAVVATQVGELAARSANAAKETESLITNSIQAIEAGKQITEQTVAEFSTVVSEIENASNSVYNISGLVKQNVSIVTQAVEGLGLISEVVEQNVEISKNTEQVSANMASETNQLLKIIE